MSSCYKCGAETPDGVVECSECDSTKITHAPANQVLIDWGKVTTFEELKIIMSEVSISVTRGSDTYTKLRKWLKE